MALERVAIGPARNLHTNLVRAVLHLPGGGNAITVYIDFTHIPLVTQIVTCHLTPMGHYFEHCYEAIVFINERLFLKLCKLKCGNLMLRTSHCTEQEIA